MNITARKIGSSPILVDWTALAQITPGSGPAARKIDQSDSELHDRLAKTWERLKSDLADNQASSFFNASDDPKIHQLEACQNLAERILSQKNFTDCLFLGIGGSALGPLSMLEALQDPASAPMKFHFFENPDPVDWRRRSALLDPSKTLVVLVTKSGGTFETMSLAMVALDWIGRDRWSSHVVAITDPEKGDLRKLASQLDIPSLPIDPQLGGRYSVFSPVGIFPGLLAGLNMNGFLEGARLVTGAVEKLEVAKNPLFLVAHHLIEHFENRPIHVWMPYSTCLRSAADWWVQLWGESLGKDDKGFTPLACLGATDQHSILQLLRDGPDDKITWFVTVDQSDDPVQLPELNSQLSDPLKIFSVLEGSSLGELINIEYQAIAKVLTNQNRPHLTVQLADLSAKSLGALYSSMCVLTAFLGYLWELNPFDQPGVEEGKKYILKSLSQKGEFDS